MHRSNREWWRVQRRAYPECFCGDIKVREFGSHNVNGTVRRFFDVEDYVGIDWRPGDCVDVVSLAHDYKVDPEMSIDTVVSSSMLEHDPFWSASVLNMVRLLKPGGALFLTWGSAVCEVHELRSAPDHDFHSLPTSLLAGYIEHLGCGIQSVGYEGRGGRGNGYATLHAWRDSSSVKEPEIEALSPEDVVPSFLR